MRASDVSSWQTKFCLHYASGAIKAMRTALTTLRRAALLLAALALAYQASHAVAMGSRPGLPHFSSVSSTRSVISGMRDDDADMARPASEAASLSSPGERLHCLQEARGKEAQFVWEDVAVW